MCLIGLCEKNALKIKFLLVSCPHFLKSSFKLFKYGLSYSLKLDPRPFLEFTRVWTILSLIASKMDFWGCHWLTRNSIGDNSPFNQLWISSLSMAASKIHSLEAINDEMVQTRVNFDNVLISCFRLYLRPHLFNLNDFCRKFWYVTNENWYLMQFVFT